MGCFGNIPTVLGLSWILHGLNNKLHSVLMVLDRLVFVVNMFHSVLRWYTSVLDYGSLIPMCPFPDPRYSENKGVLRQYHTYKYDSWVEDLLSRSLPFLSILPFQYHALLSNLHHCSSYYQPFLFNLGIADSDHRRCCRQSTLQPDIFVGEARPLCPSRPEVWQPYPLGVQEMPS
jgi:hypothetical protein